MFAFLFGIVATLSFSLSSIAAPAQLPVTHVENVNGFEVHFVNVGRGDTIGFGFYVPYGSLHDTNSQMGRAHMLEHFLHNGTVRHPGYHTFDEILRPVGANTNAYTSGDTTFYFLSTKKENAAVAMPVFFGMLGGLEWNSSTFAQENKVVINEIAEERIPSDNGAMNYMPLLYLLKEGHPWSKHAMLGDTSNLSAMTVDNLKSLYDRYYTPKKVKVVVMGNFSQNGSLEEIISLAKQWLKPHGNVLDSDADQVPSLISSATGPSAESSRRIIMDSPAQRMGTIMLEIELPRSGINSSALGLLQRYLSLRGPGSVHHKLVTELGLASNIYVGSHIFKNRILLDLSYEATEKGSAQKTEIEAIFFRALSQIRDHGIPAETLASIKESTSKSIEQSARDVNSLLYSYAEILAEDGDLIAQEKVMNATAQADVSKLIRKMHPQLALYMSMEPTSDGTVDPVFNRRFKIVPNDSTLKELTKAFSEGDPSLVVHMKPVDLGPLNEITPTGLFAQSRPGFNEKLHFAAHFRQDLPDINVAIQLETLPSMKSDLGAIDLYLAAFKERYAGEFSYLSMKYFTSLRMGRANHVLQIEAQGDNRYSARALEWTLARLHEFVPTDEELKRAEQNLRTRFTEQYRADFTAKVAADLAFSQLDPLRLSTLENRDALNAATAKETWARLMGASLKSMYMVGNLEVKDGLRILDETEKLSPKTLPAGTSQALAHRVQWTPSGAAYVKPPEARSGDGYGSIRIYKGPEIKDHKEIAAFASLATLLSTRVSNYNRGDQGLGYIHSVAWRTFALTGYMYFYGQTEGFEKSKLTIAGWEHILNLLKNGDLPDSEIQESIESEINTRTKEKSTAEEFADHYRSGHAMYQHARAEDDIVAALRKITPADVRRIAEKYLLDPQVKYSQLTLGNCEGLLTN